MQNVKTRYFITGDNFNSMKDGEYRFFKKFNYTYLVLVKRYSVNCYFNVVRMDGFT